MEFSLDKVLSLLPAQSDLLAAFTEAYKYTYVLDVVSDSLTDSNLGEYRYYQREIELRPRVGALHDCHCVTRQLGNLEIGICVETERDYSFLLVGAFRDS